MALKAGDVYVDLSTRVDLPGFERYKQELDKSRADAKRGARAELGAKVDDKAFAEFRAALDRARREKATAKLDVETGPGMAKIAVLRKELDSVEHEIEKGKRYDLDTTVAEAKAAHLRHSINEIGRQTALGELRKEFAATGRDADLLAGKLGGGGPGGGGRGLAGAASSASGGVGMLARAAVLGAPAVVGLAGALTSLVGSLSGAVLGGGAVAGGVFGVAAVGIGSIVAAAIPAVLQVKEVAKAQQTYNQAVRQYGPASKQAEEAQKKLNEVMKQAGGGGVQRLVHQAEDFGREWTAATTRARVRLIGLANDGIAAFRKLIPTAAHVADESALSLRKALKPVWQTLGGADTKATLKTLGDGFRDSIGPGVHAIQEGLRAFGHVAAAAVPYVKELAHYVDDGATRFERWTRQPEKLDGALETLVGHWRSWWHLLVDTGSLLTTILTGGAAQGKGMVDSLDKIVKRTNDWLQSAGGQKSMMGFFRDSATLLKVLLGALGPVVAMFATLARSLMPAFVAVAREMTPMIKVASDGLRVMGNGLSWLVKNVPGFKQLVAAFAVLAITMKALQFGAQITGIAKIISLYRTLQRTAAAAEATAAAGGKVNIAGRIAQGISGGIGRIRSAAGRAASSIVAPFRRAGAVAGAEAGTEAAGRAGMGSGRVRGLFTGIGRALGKLAGVGIIAAIGWSLLDRSTQEHLKEQGHKLGKFLADGAKDAWDNVVRTFGGDADQKTAAFGSHALTPGGHVPLGNRPGSGLPNPRSGLNPNAGGHYGGLVTAAGVIPGFQAGGLIPPGEDLLIGAKRNEFVVRAPVVRRPGVLPMLNDLNRHGPAAVTGRAGTGTLGGTPAGGTGIAKTVEDEARKMAAPVKRTVEELGKIRKGAKETGELSKKDLTTNFKQTHTDTEKETKRQRLDVVDHYTKMRKDATKQADQLHDDATKSFKDTRTTAGRDLDRLRRDVATKVSGAASDADKHFRRIESSAGGHMGRARKLATAAASALAGGSAGSFASLDSAIATALSYIENAANTALRGFSAKPLGFKIPRPPAVSAHQGGGVIPGEEVHGRQDRFTLLDPLGRPVALMGGGEGIVNDPQMGVIDQGLAIAHKATGGAFQYGGLGDVWDRVTGSHAFQTGGRMLRRFAGGGKLPGVYTVSWFDDPQSASGRVHVPGWAELSDPAGSLNFSALGGLPMGTNITANWRGQSVTVPKTDVGAGGPGLAGKIRAVDLTKEAKDKLRGFDGLANMLITSGAGGGHITAPKLTGTGPLAGLGQNVIAQATAAANSFIDHEASQFSGATSGAGGANPRLQAFSAFIQKLGFTPSEAPWLPGGVSPGAHHSYGAPDHMHGGAIDVGPPSRGDELVRITEAAFRAGTLAPWGPGIIWMGGRLMRPNPVGDHTDHVHISAHARGRRLRKLASVPAAIAKALFPHGKAFLNQLTHTAEGFGRGGLRRFASGGLLTTPLGGFATDPTPITAALARPLGALPTGLPMGETAAQAGQSYLGGLGITGVSGPLAGALSGSLPPQDQVNIYDRRVTQLVEQYGQHERQHNIDHPNGLTSDDYADLIGIRHQIVDTLRLEQGAINTLFQSGSTAYGARETRAKQIRARAKAQIARVNSLRARLARDGKRIAGSHAGHNRKLVRAAQSLAKRAADIADKRRKLHRRILEAQATRRKRIHNARKRIAEIKSEYTRKIRAVPPGRQHASRVRTLERTRDRLIAAQNAIIKDARGDYTRTAHSVDRERKSIRTHEARSLAKDLKKARHQYGAKDFDRVWRYEMERIKVGQQIAGIEAEEKAETGAVGKIGTGGLLGQVLGDETKITDLLGPLVDMAQAIPGRISDAELDLGETIAASQAPGPGQTTDQIAAGVASELAAFDASRRDLFGSFGSNFVPIEAAGGYYAGEAARAAGARFFGAVPTGGEEPRRVVNITNHYGSPPEEPHTWVAGQRFQAEHAWGS